MPWHARWAALGSKSSNLLTMSSWVDLERYFFFFSFSPRSLLFFVAFSPHHLRPQLSPYPYDGLIPVAFTLSEARTKQPSSAFHCGQRWSLLIDSSHPSLGWMLLSGAQRGVTLTRAHGDTALWCSNKRPRDPSRILYFFTR